MKSSEASYGAVGEDEATAPLSLPSVTRTEVPPSTKPTRDGPDVVPRTMCEAFWAFCLDDYDHFDAIDEDDTITSFPFRARSRAVSSSKKKKQQEIDRGDGGTAPLIDPLAKPAEKPSSSSMVSNSSKGQETLKQESVAVLPAETFDPIEPSETAFLKETSFDDRVNPEAQPSCRAEEKEEDKILEYYLGSTSSSKGKRRCRESFLRRKKKDTGPAPSSSTNRDDDEKQGNKSVHSKIRKFFGDEPIPNRNTQGKVGTHSHSEIQKDTVSEGLTLRLPPRPPATSKASKDDKRRGGKKATRKKTTKPIASKCEQSKIKIENIQHVDPERSVGELVHMFDTANSATQARNKFEKRDAQETAEDNQEEDSSLDESAIVMIDNEDTAHIDDHDDQPREQAPSPALSLVNNEARQASSILRMEEPALSKNARRNKLRQQMAALRKKHGFDNSQTAETASVASSVDTGCNSIASRGGESRYEPYSVQSKPKNNKKIRSRSPTGDSLGRKKFSGSALARRYNNAHTARLGDHRFIVSRRPATKYSSFEHQYGEEGMAVGNAAQVAPVSTPVPSSWRERSRYLRDRVAEDQSRYRSAYTNLNKWKQTCDNDVYYRESFNTDRRASNQSYSRERRSPIERYDSWEYHKIYRDHHGQNYEGERFDPERKYTNRRELKKSYPELLEAGPEIVGIGALTLDERE